MQIISMSNFSIDDNCTKLLVLESNIIKLPENNQINLIVIELKYILKLNLIRENKTLIKNAINIIYGKIFIKITSF